MADYVCPDCGKTLLSLMAFMDHPCNNSEETTG